ncbi:MAG: ABC transporter ATP-binding protein [Lachnospiraceae bacterium]|nr:ABC transporter ATP-binding protein [Lachnospiraceae bacterium]
MAIQVENVFKQYRNGVQALDGISLTVRQGEIFSLLGQNSAGKSTLINVLTTFLQPTSGKVMMLDKDISKDALSIRSRIACVAQRVSIDTHLSLCENMLFQSKLYKIQTADAKKQMGNLISCFGLEHFMNYPVSSYSGGVKRRLDIALNMMSNPDILFLDEPTVGMDVQSRMAMWDMICKTREKFGTTIFLTTHYLEEADSLSDTLCIVKDGKTVIQGTPCALREYLHQDVLKITFSRKQYAERYLQELSTLFRDRRVEIHGNTVAVGTKDHYADLHAAADFVIKRGAPVLRIEIAQPTIEDVFVRLTSDHKEVPA